jgi:uncharacterized protein YbjT (DUF2867 family)
MTVLVMGATGNVGGVIVEALREQGVPVRAVSRNARDWPDGVEGYTGDPGEPGGLTAAARGATGVFLMSGYAAEAALLSALDGAHVVVLSSSSAPLGEDGNAMAGYHLASEQAVQASGHDWTVLRPCSFQSNLLRWRDQLEQGDVVRVPFGDVPSALVDPADIAAVATAALTGAGHAGRTYRLSGPEALTPAAQLALLAPALDRPLRLEAMPDEEALATLPEAYAGAMMEIFRGHPELESEVQPTVEEVLRRPPGRLTAWIDRNRGAFSNPRDKPDRAS